MRGNISYDYNRAKIAGISHFTEVCQTPQETVKKKGGICRDQARFSLYCLLVNGYRYNNFEVYKDEAACYFYAHNKPLMQGHDVCLYIKDDIFYTIDNGSIKGPLSTITQAADATWRSWTECGFADVKLNITKRIRKGY